jgi:hypothetical protein
LIFELDEHIAMNKTIALILAVSAIFLAGCSSPIRTLEWKGGKVLLTEERHFGRPPLTWELKVVSSAAEKDTLRKAGWKLADGPAMLSINWQRVDGAALHYVLHHEGGADTFLMKRKMDAQTADLTLAAPPSFRPMLITSLGTTTSPNGMWRIEISENAINLSHYPIGGSVGFTPDSHGWTTHPGWFVFIENESRVWAYDGDRMLCLQTFTSSGNTSGWEVRYGDFPCHVPAEVFFRLSKQKQEDIQPTNRPDAIDWLETLAESDGVISFSPGVHLPVCFTNELDAFINGQGNSWRPASTRLGGQQASAGTCVGSRVLFDGAAGSGNADLKIGDDVFLEVELTPNQEVRPHARNWVAEVVGVLKSIDREAYHSHQGTTRGLEGLFI